MRNLSKRSKFALITLGMLSLLAAFNCKKSKTDEKEIFTDNFDRADSGGLGANWTVYTSGTFFTISGGKALPLGGNFTTEAGLPTALYTQRVTGGFKMSAKFSISGGNYLSAGYLIGRSVAGDVSTNSYLCGYYWTGAGTGTVPDPYKYNFGLRKETSGAVASLADIPMHLLTSGITDTITMTFDGSKITCEMAGNSTISVSVTNSSYSDGFIGITGGGAVNNPAGSPVGTQYLYFDDFHAEKL